MIIGFRTKFEVLIAERHLDLDLHVQICQNIVDAREADINRGRVIKTRNT